MEDSAKSGTDGQQLDVTISGAEGSPRLDRVLALHVPALSRSRLQALIKAGAVTSGAVTLRDPAYHAAPGETITIRVPPTRPAEPQGEAIALDIVFEDDDIIVLNKPAGLVVHPAAGHETGTLVNALIAHCGASLSGIGGVRRPGIVHRLDKDTTGLLIVAKNDAAHQALSAQFADHGRTGPLRRAYKAIVWGVPDRLHGVIDAPLDRHPHARERMAVCASGREAITHWAVEEAFAGPGGRPVAALIDCELETGRTHQIRVHLAHIGHPLLGDSLYGSHFRTKANQLAGATREALAQLGRQALHAYRLVVEHPRTGEIVAWESGLPTDMDRLRAALAAAQ